MWLIHNVKIIFCEKLYGNSILKLKFFFFFLIVLQAFPMHLTWYQISYSWLLVSLALCFATVGTILTSGIFILSPSVSLAYEIVVVNYIIKICSISLQGELWGWTCFYVAVTSVAFGSSYYHLGPDDAGLVWDRFPVSFSYRSWIQFSHCCSRNLYSSIS